MATLTISRTRQFINYFRNYKILINGQEITQLEYGEHKNLTLAAGTHTIKAKIDWTSSETYEITLTEHETQTLEIGCNITQSKAQNILNILGFVVLLGSIALYEEITPLAWVLLLSMWVVRDIVLTKGKSFIYYITTGRSTYLYIKPLAPIVVP
ncbi:MAG: hypothetical protein V4590_13105 [Bacteroidota bacterium]